MTAPGTPRHGDNGHRSESGWSIVRAVGALTEPASHHDSEHNDMRHVACIGNDPRPIEAAYCGIAKTWEVTA
jgi:hypothetical protein